MILMLNRPQHASTSKHELICTRQEDTVNYYLASIIFDVGVAECERKIKATNRFLPDAIASNKLGPGTSEKPLDDKSRKAAMEVHRDLVCGVGFSRSIAAGHRLYKLDLFARAGPELNKAVLEQIFPCDRDSFQSYMRALPLGLGLINAVGYYFDDMDMVSN